MGGACAPAGTRTITQYMNGLCRSRQSAGLLDPSADLRLGHLPKLEMTYDAIPIDEERAREAEHTVAARRRAFGVQHRLQPVEPERVEEGACLVARLHEVDLEDDDAGLARRDALQSGQLLAARRAPGGPEVHDDHLAAVRRKPKSLAIRTGPLEVGGGRSDAAGGSVGVDLRADDARIGRGRGPHEQRPQQGGERGERDGADDDRGDPPWKRGRLAVRVLSGQHAHPTSGRKLNSCGSLANCPDTSTIPITMTSVTAGTVTARVREQSHL